MRPRRRGTASGTPTEAGSKERRAVDVQFSLAYEELRRLAAAVPRRGAGVTLRPTALVAEAWLKLAAYPEFAQTSPLHFTRIAARAMRQVLVEAGRCRVAAKRGGAAMSLVTLDDDLPVATWGEDVLALDGALRSLEALEPRQAVVVEARFFGGLEMPEIACALEVSVATVERDWRAARAWLARELRERP